MKTIDVYLLWGLPASGKTYWSKILAKTRKKVKIVDLDSNFKTFHETLKEESKKYKVFIFDGFLNSNISTRKLLDRIEDTLGPKIKIVYTIFFFPENRELCLKNDVYRNKIEGRPLSNLTIKNTPFKVPKLNLLDPSGDRQINIVKKEVVDSEYLSFKEKYKLEDVLRSYHWVVSSSDRNGEAGYYHEEPRDFDELDNLLLEICPNISFLHYKKIRKECAEVKEEYDGDYYSSYTYQYHHCDVKKLYTALDKLGLVK